MPTEFQSYAQIADEHGDAGPGLQNPAEITDDTQMTLYLAEALQRPASTDDELRQAIVREFIAWRDDPDTMLRAPGMTCLRSISSLKERGVRIWGRATTLESKGCGANMRAAPAAFLSSDLVGPVAAWQAALTHGHPTGILAAWATAAVVEATLDGDVAPGRQLEWTLAWLESGAFRAAEGWDRGWMRPLERATGLGFVEYLGRGVEELRAVLSSATAGLGGDDDPCLYGGEGWVAEEALASALVCADRTPGDPVAALRRAAFTGGDSDSIGAITGALVGADAGAEDALAVYRPQIEASYLDWIVRLTEGGSEEGPLTFSA